jgi:enoyl-[acyl-carrier protein] reductase II
MDAASPALPPIGEPPAALPPMAPDAAYAALDRLMARGRAFLGARWALLGGAMSWVSERSLVAALSNAGAFGVIACGAMEPPRLAEEIAATQAMTRRPFGVNLITMHPRLMDLLEVCLAAGVSHIVFAGGIPPGPAIRRAKEGGAKVICFAPALALAKKLVRSGADALVIEGSEAGGHIGPVSLTVLAQEILPAMAAEVPVFVAGGLGRGEAILSFLEMGAAGAQLGTRFVCATESIAHPDFKRAFIRAAARDALPSVQLDERFPVIPVRALQNQGTRRFLAFQAEVIRRFQAGEVAREAAQLEIEHFWAGALRRAVIEGDVENGSLMAGQSVGFVTAEQPAAEIVAELVGQAAAALAARRPA